MLSFVLNIYKEYGLYMGPVMPLKLVQKPIGASTLLVGIG
jgi:hypothetical protein